METKLNCLHSINKVNKENLFSLSPNIKTRGNPRQLNPAILEKSGQMQMLFYNTRFNFDICYHKMWCCLPPWLASKKVGPIQRSQGEQ